MKLIYILALGHSGSTLTDCILGTYPDFISSGELRYLNWQLARTKDVTPTVNAQNICTCEKDFRECEYWSQVFVKIKEETECDIIANPHSFDTAYFNQFAYQDRNYSRPFYDKFKARVTRVWCEKGWSYKLLPWSKDIEKWLKNNWLLYTIMADVVSKKVVVDSSKHPMIALLLQQYKPEDVTILFLQRSAKGLAASNKKWAKKRENDFKIDDTIESKQKFEERVQKYKDISGLKYIDADYEEVVQAPADFLDKVVQKIGANQNYPGQNNEAFYIDPSKQHMVAGNPMRYRGKQLVKYDESWKERLSLDELKVLKNF